MSIETQEQGWLFVLSLIFAQGQRAENREDKVRSLKSRIQAKSFSHIIGLCEDEVTAAIAESPALHRFPRRTARLVQQMIALIVEQYGSDPRRIWRDSTTVEARSKLLGLPGIGPHMADTALYILAVDHAELYDYDLENVARASSICPRIVPEALHLLAHDPTPPEVSSASGGTSSADTVSKGVITQREKNKI